MKHKHFDFSIRNLFLIAAAAILVTAIGVYKSHASEEVHDPSFEAFTPLLLINTEGLQTASMKDALGSAFAAPTADCDQGTSWLQGFGTLCETLQES